MIERNYTNSLVLSNIASPVSDPTNSPEEKIHFEILQKKKN